MPESVGDPNCASCGGSGWVRVADGGAGSAQLCECSKRARLIRTVRALGIPPKYQSASFQNFQARKNPSLLAALQSCRQYVADFARLERATTSRGLLFTGVPGVGKTHLAVATLRAIVGAGLTSGRFLDFTSFVSDIQSTFDPASPESKHDLLDPVLTTGLLVLDDLGARQPTPFVNEILYLIVNTRYVHQRPTLFTTNLQLEAPARPAAREREPFSRPADSPDGQVHLLSSRLPSLLVSRLFEMTRTVAIDADDYRKVVGNLKEVSA